MKEAIQKAIEGGWRPRGVADARFRKRLVSATEFYYAESHEADFWMADSETREDPLFWSSLGKAMGWYEYQEITVELPKDEKEAKKKWMDIEDNIGVILKLSDRFVVYSPSKKDALTWDEQWHCFIDHLAKGKDAESFFKDLLK